MKKLNFLIILILIFVVSCSKNKVKTTNQSTGANRYQEEGIMYLSSGDFNKAEIYLEKANKMRPGQIVCLNYLGVIKMYKGQFKEAAECFNKVLNIDRSYIDAHNNLGIVYTEMNNYHKAKEHLLVAANSENYRTPENAYLNLAKLELKHKRLNAASRYVKKAIEANKEFSPIYNIKGLILEEQKDYKGAVVAYKKSLSFLRSDDPDILLNLGRVLAATGKKNESLNSLERALAISKNDAQKKLIRELINYVEKKL